MRDDTFGRLDAAQMGRFDTNSVIADRAESEPLTPAWQTALDGAIAHVRALNDEHARETAYAAQIDRELQHELAARDREWWA